MKKVFYFLAVWLAGSLFFCGTAAAAADMGMTERIAEQAGMPNVAGTTEYSVSQTVGNIIRSVLSLLGVIFLVLTIYAGVLWGTAAGNDEKIEKAKKILISSFIGLVIVGAAYGITALVMYFVLGGPAPSTNVQEPWIPPWINP